MSRAELQEKFKKETGLDSRHPDYIIWLEKYLKELKKN